MSVRTTFTRARPDDGVAVSLRDLTPSALGMVGTIVVTEDAAVDGGAVADVVEDAFSWVGVYGARIDPRTQRPHRRAPWVGEYPSDLLTLVTDEPLSVYLTAPDPLTYSNLLSTLASKLGQWGWSSVSETV